MRPCPTRRASLTAALLIALATTNFHAEAASGACAPVELLAGPLPALPSGVGDTKPIPDQPTGLVMPGRAWRGNTQWWALVCAGERPSCALHATRLRVKNVTWAAAELGDPVQRGQYLHWSPLPNGLDRAPPAGTARPAGEPQVLAVFRATRAQAPTWLKSGRVTTWLHAGMPRAAFAPPQDPAWPPGLMGVAIPSVEAEPPLLVPRVTSRSSTDIDVFELRHGSQRQQLPGYHSAPSEDSGPMPVLEPSGYLRWAGDLDGDGRPDLLLTHGDGTEADTVLYRSTARGEADPDVNAHPGCDRPAAAVRGPLVGAAALSATRP